MTYFADEASAAAALNDPATSRADLMSIAYAFPSLGAGVARHANAYPGLLDWLEQFGTPKARAEVAAVRAETPPPVYRPARGETTPDAAATPAWTPPAPVTPAVPAATPAWTPPAPVAPVVAAPVVAAPVTPAPVTPAPAFVAPTPAAATVTEPTEYISPFDEYSDEPEPAPRASDNTPDDETDDEHETHHGWSKGQKALVISLISAIAVLGIVAVIIFGSVLPKHRALQAAQNSSPTAVQAFGDAQTALQAQISAAAPLGTVGPANVSDATTLTTLTSALATAQSLVGDPPAMGSTTDEINQQVTDLNNKTAEANDAAQSLQSAIDGVQQSRIDLAVSTLQTILSDAQGSYDDSSWMGDTPARTQLQGYITQVTAATNNPSTLGSDPDSIVAALGNMGPTLQGYTDAVNAANKVSANKTFTYLLQGADQVTCGVNICYSGVGGGDPMSVASVQVTVKGTNVTAKLCFMMTDPVDPNTCQSTSGDGGGNSGWSEPWTGTRDGTTAVIISTSKDKAEFNWGTLTFNSSAPNAAVTSFASADSCEKSDGSGYGTLVNGSCQ